MTLDDYRPSVKWYLQSPFGIHGLGHAARVLFWADRIGNWMISRGLPVDLEAVRWAAALHDVRRIDDGGDFYHGQRAADWIRDGNPTVLRKLLDPSQRECVAYCCAWHVPDDAESPRLTNELLCLKDADSLDRVRLGNLDPSYLRAECARDLCEPAQDLLDLSLSARADDPWRAVGIAVPRLGLSPLAALSAATPNQGPARSRSAWY